ncbi:hypothetical protein GGU10DRAFT_410408 [Lentinula aff. detonsa]|uniref:ABC1 atypical kinase-like domain-containing protein n=1 Tax=Lentinula aff. detonsa TaxID=2804958 RepID=A0AA38KPD1_9AGAR|nr:hypothetical protein GGU10DRAFT_410408 [Lentinula aff. detonsa]
MTRSFLILPLIASLCITFPAFTHAAPTAFQNVTNSQLEARNVPGILSKAEILREHDVSRFPPRALDCPNAQALHSGRGFWGYMARILTTKGTFLVSLYFSNLYFENFAELRYLLLWVIAKTLPIHTRISNSDIPPRLDDNGGVLERYSRTKIAYVLDDQDQTIGVAKGYLKNEELDKWEAHAEVKALQATAKSSHEFDYGKKYGWPVAYDFRPVIVMNYVEGVDIVDSEQYQNAPRKEQKEMEKRYMKLLQNEVYYYVKKKGILHADFHSGNVRVTFNGGKIKKVKLIDWGYPGVFTVKKSVSEKDFKKWFVERFAFCNRQK